MVNVKGVIKGYGRITKEAAEDTRAWRNEGGGAGLNMGMMEKLNGMGGWAVGNLQDDAMKNGATVLGQMGRSALKGAAWGGVIGGTSSALQGGSFWDGAKQGAFNGAVGVAAYRTAMRATGAMSMNPFAAQTSRSTGGLLSSANTMWRTMNHDGEISKQAISILNNRQSSGLARSFMNQQKRS
jgi:hypothetical protein